MLLTDDALARIITNYEFEIEELRLVAHRYEKQEKELVAYEQKVCQVKVDAAQQQLQTARGTCDKQVDVLKRALVDCEKRRSSVWRSPYLNFILGNVVAGGVCAAVSIGTR